MHTAIFNVYCMQSRPEGGKSNASEHSALEAFSSTEAKQSGEESLKAEDARQGVHRPIQICLEKCSCTADCSTRGKWSTRGYRLRAVPPQQLLASSLCSQAPAPARQPLHLMACFNGSREKKQGWKAILGADQRGTLWAHTFAAEGASDTGGGRCSAFFKMFILGLILPAGSTSSTHMSLACHWQAVSQHIAIETGKCKIMT